jgi:hypothetical protein
MVAKSQLSSADNVVLDKYKDSEKYAEAITALRKTEVEEGRNTSNYLQQASYRDSAGLQHTDQSTLIAMLISKMDTLINVEVLAATGKGKEIEAGLQFRSGANR